MAEAKVTGIDTSLTQALGNLANAEQQRDRHLADLAIAQQEAQARIAETTDARSENLRLNDRVVDGISVRRTLEDDLLDRQGRIDEAVQRELQMVEELARLRGLLRTNKIDPNDSIVGPVPAPVEKITGVVTAAKKNESRSAELVEISIGSDDGIAKGMRLIVYRGAKYICEIEITEIYPDLSVGRVIESTRNGNIEREDNVTTKL
jgi:small-conductance mechanosensitive channel